MEKRKRERLRDMLLGNNKTIITLRREDILELLDYIDELEAQRV